MSFAAKFRTTTLCRFAGIAALSLCASSAFAQFNFSQKSEYPTDPNLHAILIGCEDYQYFPPLRFCTNDCVRLSDTLVMRGGYDPQNVELIVDNPPGGLGFRPVRQVVLRELEERLGRLRADDQVLIFFSGHGYRDDAGRLYLATTNCDPKNPAETGVPVEWLRDQLAKCPAKYKLLVLDACHAGSDKGEETVKDVVAKDLGEPFRDVAGVMTLASSTADEKSQLWEEKEQSLFTYWLNQGLRGHADENGDSEVDIDELNKYVHRNVTRVAKQRFNRAQTPVRIFRGAAGVPVVMKLNPLSLKALMSDIAEQLSWSLDDREIDKVAVLEFTSESGLSEVLGANYGLLGKQCAVDLERLLTQRGSGAYSVIDQRRLQNALKQQQFSVADLGSDNAMKELSTKLDGLPAIAQGVLRGRQGRAITLQCKLLDTETGAIAASAGGVAMLNPSEWAMLGHSAELHDNDFAPPGPGTENKTEADLVVFELDKKSKQEHPLADPNCAFPVKLRVNGKIREGVFKGNDYIVPVQKDDVYAVEVENRYGRPMIMRLLIDGLNSLPQKEIDTKGVATYMVAPRVSLEEARYWVCDPKKSRRFGVRGFITQTGAQGVLNEFKIVDGADSVAARQQFTDQLGIITVAVYDAEAISRGGDFNGALGSAGPGTGFGQQRQEQLEEAEEYRIGQLRSVIHIRYATPEAIEAWETNQQNDGEAPAPAPASDSST